MVHGDTRRETQFLKVYANHTMLTPPQCVAHLVMFKISIHLCQLRSTCLNGRKPNFNSQRLNTQLHLSTVKILKFSGPCLLDTTSSKLQSHFLSGSLLWQMVIVISFACEHKTAPSDYAPELRDRNGSKSYQTEW